MPDLEYSADERAAVLEIFLAGHGQQFVNVLVLREAVAALQRDQKRLDWLEGKDRVHIEPTPDNKSVACSLREAIDGAMAKEKASA